MRHFVFSVLFVVCLFANLISTETLYEVLGVSKQATEQEIKKAYKSAARKWHPDKNRAAGANERFMKINEAYETLADPKKRHEYDTFGRTASDNTPNHPAHHPFQGGGFDPFEAFFGGRFNRNEREEEQSPAFQNVDYRQFKLELMPESETQPFLIYGYGDFCFPCMRVNPVWRRAGEELMPLGVGMRVFNVEYDGHLRDELRVHYVPSIFALIDGVPRYFRGSEISTTTLRHFLRDVFPAGLFTEVDDHNWRQVLQGWTDNRVRFLMISPSRIQQPPLRLYMAAYRYRYDMQAAWTTPQRAPELMRRMGVVHSPNDERETLLVFHEDEEHPAASLSSDSLKPEVMWELLNEHRFLDLPRLSSPRMLDRLCPPEMRPERKTLCVLIVCTRGQERNPEMRSFREYARKMRRSSYGSRVRLGYIYDRVQMAFLTSIGAPTPNLDHHVVILWRKTSQNVAYRWLRRPWNASNQGNSRSLLEDTLHGLIYGTAVLADEVVMPQLYDEHGASLIVRMWRRCIRWSKLIVDYVSSFDPAMVTTTFFVGCITIMLLSSMWIAAKREEAAFKKEAEAKQRRRPQPHETAGRRPDNRPMITELRARTYGDLVTGSRQGHITFVLLLTADTREKLLTDYVQYIIPFSRVSKVTFAITLLESHASWFKKMLAYTLNQPETWPVGEVNLKNCAGTVLAINGFRKYFCIYHPKIRSAMTPHDRERCHFLGFDDSSCSSESSDDEEKRKNLPPRSANPLLDPRVKLFHRDLLSGLPNWLDRVFDGSLPRIRVDSWPPLPVDEEMRYDELAASCSEEKS